MSATKRILVPTDFSKYAEAAFEKAVEIAVQNQAQLYLLHVIDHYMRQCAADYCIDDRIMAQIEKTPLSKVAERLQQMGEAVSREKGIEVFSELKEGNPSEVILQQQRDKKIDLIVVASHGKSAILRNLIGSIASKVVTGADCNVLVVKS